MRNFEEFREIVYSFRLPRLILSALDFDLFTIMGSRTWSVKVLAKKLQVSERGLDILCRNLAGAGLLVKHGTRYQSGKLGQTLLNAQSPAYRGAYLDLMRQQWEDWAQLTRSIRTGKPVEEQGDESPGYRQSFTWAMHHRSIEPAKQVADQINLKQVRTFLDLGGGPGTYALAFLGKNPHMQATIMDRPEALTVARAIAAPLKQGKRLSFHAGDFFSDAIPGKYDVIWLSNVLHIYSAKENTKLFRRLRTHVNPGGQILIQDTFLLDPEGLYPVETNLFAGTMLLFTETGNTYHLAEVKKWLVSSGFRRPTHIQLKKGTGDWEGVILKAVKPLR